MFWTADGVEFKSIWKLCSPWRQAERGGWQRKNWGSRLMLHRWEYVDQLTLLMWDWNDGVLSRMTPRLLTWVKGETEELSLAREKLATLENVNFTIGLRDDMAGIGTKMFPNFIQCSIMDLLTFFQELLNKGLSVSTSLSHLPAMSGLVEWHHVLTFLPCNSWI